MNIEDLVGDNQFAVAIITAATDIEQHIMPMDNRSKIESLYRVYEVYNLLLTYIEERIDELKSNDTTGNQTNNKGETNI